MAKSLNTSLEPTARQKSLLFAVIKEYCDTGQGIGSKEIKQKYDFEFSSATIRNEFVHLRDSGYLYQPFTNSPSQPTEKAFRLFINQLIGGLRVTNQQQQLLKEHILKLEKEQANLNKEITRLLALQAGGVGFSVDKSTESVSGINNLLKSPSEGSVSDILDFLENLDRYKIPLLEGASELENQLQISKPSSKPKKKNLRKITTIFGDNPVLPLGKGYAMVATEAIIEGEKNVFGLIAPTHLLAQKKNLELVQALSKALDNDS